MRSNLSLRRSLALACIVGCSGCSSSPGQGKLPDLLPVKGTVTYKGKPLTKGQVQFEPDGYGRPASGKIQSDGTYALTTLKEGDGVVAGHHRVAVVGTGPTPRKEIIPKKYTQVGTSKIEVDIDAGHTEHNIELQ